jgi:hypothetical protein
MSETKHTPIPWYLQNESDDYTHIVRGPKRIFVVQCSQTETGKANAEFIVLAVNAHEALVEACRKSLKNGCSCHSSIMPNWHAEKCHILDVKAALRLAESTALATEVRDGEDV